MSPWIETSGVLLLAAAGILIGKWFSSLSGKRWLWGYGVSLSIILMIGTGRRFYPLVSTPPFSWLLAGRMPFAISGFAIAMLLGGVIYRCQKERERKFLWVLLVVCVSAFSVAVFLGPALNRQFLLSLKTQIDADGVCRQNTDYTCGPAAAVTALRWLGFPAEEGELAILAHTSSLTGTPPDILTRTLREKYAGEGLTVEFRGFKSVSELNRAGITVALIKFSFLLDHYVTVLAIDEKSITVADPLAGKAVLSHDEFLKKWRFAGVHLERISSK